MEWDNTKKIDNLNFLNSKCINNIDCKTTKALFISGDLETQGLKEIKCNYRNYKKLEEIIKWWFRLLSEPVNKRRANCTSFQHSWHHRWFGHQLMKLHHTFSSWKDSIWSLFRLPHRHRLIECSQHIVLLMRQIQLLCIIT